MFYYHKKNLVAILKVNRTDIKKSMLSVYSNTLKYICEKFHWNKDGYQRNVDIYIFTARKRSLARCVSVHEGGGLYPSMPLSGGGTQHALRQVDVDKVGCVDGGVWMGGMDGRVWTEGVWTGRCTQPFPSRQPLKRTVCILLEFNFVVTKSRYTYSTFLIKCLNLIF